jgi:hypothetical protein
MYVDVEDTAMEAQHCGESSGRAIWSKIYKHPQINSLRQIREGAAWQVQSLYGNNGVTAHPSKYSQIYQDVTSTS